MEFTFNVNDLKNKVKPNVERNSLYLTLAYDALDRISIPGDFYYYNSLNATICDIKDLKDENEKLKEWLNNSILNLASVESENNQIISQLTGSLDNLNSKTTNTGATVAEVDNDKYLMENGYDAKFYRVFNKMRQTAAQVSENVKSTILEQLELGADILCNSENPLVRGIAVPLVKIGKLVGAKVVETCEWLSTYVVTPLKSALVRTAATCINIFTAFTTGVAGYFESLFNGVVVGVSGVGMLVTGPMDAVGHLIYLKNGKKGEYNSLTKGLMQDTMAFVADNNVANEVRESYKKTILGTWLNRNALSGAKSDSPLMEIIRILGYATASGATMAGVSYLTGGGGLALAVQSAITFTSEFGRSTQEAWIKQRDSSWEGVELLYKNGEITQDEYASYVMARSLTEDQWKEIEQEFKNGIISQEQYNTIKQIRELPEEWKTSENFAKGFAYGAISGGWAALSFYLGGKFGNIALESGSKVLGSVVRVGSDAALNLADTPVRTVIEVATTGKSWEEAWEDQGGLKSMFTDAAIGLIGSIGGEIGDAITSKTMKTKSGNHVGEDLELDGKINTTKTKPSMNSGGK